MATESNSGKGNSSLPIPEKGGPFRVSSLPGAVLAAAAGTVAGFVTYLPLNSLAATVGGESRGFGLTALMAALAFFTIIPLAAGGAAGWVATKIAVKAQVVNRTLLAGASVTAVLAATVMVVIQRQADLGDDAFDSVIDVAKIGALLLVGVFVAFVIAMAESGAEPICPTCSRFFNRRIGGRRAVGHTAALRELALARDLTALQREFRVANETPGRHDVYLELWWCKGCRAIGAIEVWTEETKTNDKGETNPIPSRKRVHSTRLDGDALTPFL